MRMASSANSSDSHGTDGAQAAASSTQETGEPGIASESASKPSPKKIGSRSLWLWVAAGYLFMSILWAVMFKAAATVNVQSVPLATQGIRP